MNEWRGRISAEIHKSCPHCGPQLVEHRFFTCPLTQQMRWYVANILWQFAAKKSNLGPHKSLLMMQCLFHQHLCNTLERFNRIWFSLKSGLPWFIWRQKNNLVLNALQWPIEKTHQVIWETLQSYGRIE